MSPASTFHPSDGRQTRSQTTRSQWLFALSAANLLFLRTWAALLEARHIVPASYVMIMVNVLLAACCIRLGALLIERTRSAVVRWIGIATGAALCLVPVHAIATIYFADDVPKRNPTYLAGLLLVVAVIASSKVRRWVFRVVIFLIPSVAITFGNSIVNIATYDSARWAEPQLPAVAAARAPRLVWLLFDEWDFALTFAARRQGLRLPELDRLVNESFSATHARPPERSTAKSVPRLVTGDWDATTGNMSTHTSIFSRAKQEGLRTAAVAWFIDYCGAFRPSLDACWNSTIDAERNSMGATAAEMGITQVRYLFENQFRSPFGQPVGAKRQSLDFKFNLKSALKAVTHPGFDLVYVHFNVPHEPLFYDAATGAHHLGEKPLIAAIKKDSTRYFDALVLVDRTVGELRRALEAAGLWDQTDMLLTSDHPYRARHRVDGVRDDVRVPFIVRVAGSRDAVSHEQEFYTLLAPDLLPKLRSRELRTPSDVRDWVAARSKTASR